MQILHDNSKLSSASFVNLIQLLLIFGSSKRSIVEHNTQGSAFLADLPRIVSLLNLLA